MLQIQAVSAIEAGQAGVAKLADALDLGSSDASHGGSSPSARTRLRPLGYAWHSQTKTKGQSLPGVVPHSGTKTGGTKTGGTKTGDKDYRI
jgi:hypothetical protein